MNALSQVRSPDWWTADYDTRWDRVKAALRRDWEQTKYDMGGNAPDLNQNANDTVGQAFGKQPIPLASTPNFDEEAYRFGHGARQHYSGHSAWSPALEEQLEEDWSTTFESDDWQKHREAVRKGWEYRN